MKRNRRKTGPEHDFLLAFIVLSLVVGVYFLGSGITGLVVGDGAGISVQVVQDDCGTISSSGTYVLNQSFTTDETCFTITANHVILDGNGFSVTTTNTSADAVSATNRVNLTVMNFANLSGFEDVLYLFNCDECNITNNTLETGTLAFSNGVEIFNGAATQSVIPISTTFENDGEKGATVPLAVKLLNPVVLNSKLLPL